MRLRFTGRLEAGLGRLAEAARKGTLRDPVLAGQRLGRLLERNARAAKLFDVRIEQRPNPTRPGKQRLEIKVSRHDERQGWAELSEGCYLLGANLPADSPERLWKTYIGLTQIEDCFRVEKHDLGLRPIFHHTAERTQAHILVCFLALALWRTLQQWMAASGLGTTPRKLLEELAEVRSLDMVLPTGTGQEIRLRTVSRPEPHLTILLERLGLPLPNKPKRIENVVTKIPLEMAKIHANGDF